jgi:putative copper export protein
VLTALTLLAKFSLYLGALFSIGGQIHSALDIYYKKRILYFALSAVIVGASLKLGLANAQLGGELSAFFKSDTFNWVWQSNGAQFLAFLIGALSGLFSAWIKHKLSRYIGIAISVLCLSAGFALSGHTQSVEDAPLLPFWVVPHILIAGFWVLAPISLWPHASISNHDVMVKTERFSRLAVWMIPILFVTGIYLLWRLNPQISDIWTTFYGQLLFAKFSIALGLLGLGALNKLHVTRLLKIVPEKGRAALRRTLTIEAILFLAVILIILLATTLTGPGDHHH